MDRPMINETLFNTDTDKYPELRLQMVEELTGDEMDQPDDALKALLEDYVWRMFEDMDDDSLQSHFDTMMEAK